MKKELQNNNAIVVSGDTKVVPRGSVDKIFINTTGIGKIQKEGISSNNISKDDVVLVSRDIGRHGATIFSAREGIELTSSLESGQKQSNICIEVDEKSIPVSAEVEGICEMLGFEATNLANEGTFVLALKKEDAQKALEVLHKFDNSKNATQIAHVSDEYVGKVVLLSAHGTKRFLDTPTGELLPRIC